MYKIDFNKPIHVHFIGIGGISMSGLAEILLNEHFTVSGSDSKESPLTKQLVHKGATLFYGQTAENISDDVDLVIYTAAIQRENPELMEAVARRIPLLTRAEFLGQLMTNYDTPIAVSGTHGKTTTTSMVSHILLEGNKDPTISVGGILQTIGGNIRVGNSGTFITEACEYTNSFLNFLPKISIILNVEEDHLDFFKDIEDIRHSFHQFAKLLPADGSLIINGEIQGIEAITKDLDCNVITYGFDSSFDYSASNISFNEKGHVAYDYARNGEFIARIQLSVTGKHNVSNSLSAIATGELLNLPLDVIQRGLLSFVGTDRRFEYKGTYNGVTIVDDYAHHPTEIIATLNAAKHYPHEKIWCVFQPHTYTRTKAFFHEFAEALSLADHLVLADIYAARETNTLGMSSALLAERVRDFNNTAIYLPDFTSIEKYLIEQCKPGDLLITMGAGDVVNIGEAILSQ
ncbi:MAG: UDP-N-acetylmuramate--L-alanine ligase [Eubacteriales bacterium]